MPTSWRHTPRLRQGPIPRRGTVHLFRNLDEALTDGGCGDHLRLQKERAQRHLVTNLEDYHLAYGLLERCRPGAPVLHPGPVN